MAGGQRRGKGTGLARGLRRTASFLVLAASLPALASATPPAPADPAPAAQATTAPSPKLAKPSAYHAVEPVPASAKPLPKPVAAPIRRSNPPPGQARQVETHQNPARPTQSSQRDAQLNAHLSSAPHSAPQYREPQYPVRAEVEPHSIQTPQPLRTEVQQPPRVPETSAPFRQYRGPQPYAPPQYARPVYGQPMLTAYPETAPPPYARRILYQGNTYPQNNNQRRENGPNATEHLPAWMRKHQNESPAERERSLRMEPGFNRLPPAQQQNLVNTLHHLDEMPPEQRERTLMRMENMERLSPQMREAVRSSARQLNEMSPERRRLWQKAFRDLENMPPEQRQEILHSQEFAGQFSAQERSIMGNLLAVEPYRNPGPMEAPPLYGR